MNTVDLKSNFRTFMIYLSFFLVSGAARAAIVGEPILSWNYWSVDHPNHNRQGHSVK